MHFGEPSTHRVGTQVPPCSLLPRHLGKGAHMHHKLLEFAMHFDHCRREKEQLQMSETQTGYIKRAPQIREWGLFDFGKLIECSLTQH